MPIPSTKVEIAFNAGYLTAPGSRTWTDVSAYVEADQRVKIQRGRQDEVSEVPPSQLTLTLNNRDGRFTPEKTGGAYYPNVRIGRPIRVTVTHNAVAYVRFVGFVDDWLPGWPDGTDAFSVTTVTAGSRSKRLGKNRTMRSLVEESISLDGPRALYTLSEPEGSRSAVDTSGGQEPNLTIAGDGPTVVFGTGTGPSLDGLTAATFSGNTSGKYLTARLDLDTVPSLIGYSIFFATSETNPSVIGRLVTGSVSPTLGVANLGRVQITDGSTTLQSGTGYNDGQVHHAFVTIDGSGTTLWVDGVLIGTNVAMTAAPVSNPLFEIGGISTPNASIFGGYVGFTGTLAHFAVWDYAPSTARILSQSDAGRTAFAGDLPGARITRYATLAGVSEVTADTGQVVLAGVDTTGQTLIAAMKAVANTEGGILFDDRATSGFILRGRDARYNLAAAFTLSATSQEIEADLAPRFDDQFLVNEATATANGEPAGRVVDEASQDEFGVYDSTIETISDDANDALAAAQWRVALGKEPRSRYSTVSVDVTNSSTAQATAVLTADIGTRFALSGLPSQAPAATADLFAEGYEELLSSASHWISFNTSPAVGYDVWTIEDPVLGAYDTYPLSY